MKCLIHVGAHHTATTSFQKLLCDQSNYLKKIGIIYPECIKQGYQHSLLPGAYLPNHYALPSHRSMDIDLYIKKLKEEIRLPNCELCLLSSEVFTELLNYQKNQLLELFNKLETIFDDISIMYTSRCCKQKSFSAQRAQIRLSIANTKFRSEIFNAPERFRNKLLYSEKEPNKWKLIKKKFIVVNMEESNSPLINYINTIITHRNLNEDSYKVHLQYFKEIVYKANYKLNEDPHKPISYLLLILIGLKIKDEENYLKELLTLDLINKFIEDCDLKFKRYLFLITKLNIISFLENYKLPFFEDNEIKNVLKKAKLNFSTRIIIMKLIDDFILRLIFES